VNWLKVEAATRCLFGSSFYNTKLQGTLRIPEQSLRSSNVKEVRKSATMPPRYSFSKLSCYPALASHFQTPHRRAYPATLELQPPKLLFVRSKHGFHHSWNSAISFSFLLLSPSLRTQRSTPGLIAGNRSKP
jgi:hypothetical protein